MNWSGSLSSGNWPDTAGNNDEQPAIAFDSTLHSVYGNGLKPYARQAGFNKDDGDGLDIYKITTLLLA